MPVTIHLIRHGEGFHNVSKENESIRDPKLTEKGEKQCEHARQTFPYHSKMIRLMASPLTRALQTCILSFRTPEFIEAQKPATVICLPSFQEVSELPYDTGSPIKELNEKFDNILDLTYAHKDWFVKDTDKSWEGQEKQLFERAKLARSRLQEVIQDLPEDAHVGAASHGTFLHFATNDFSGIEPGMTTAWKNAEWRSFNLTRGSNQDGDFRLLETTESWLRRHDNDDRPSQDEQEEKKGFLLEKMKGDYHEKDT